jgi:RHS repeat-associated protein
VTKRFFGGGEIQVVNGGEVPYYYTRDHLGSIRQVTDSSGAVVASYDYDPWGRAARLSGSIDAAFGYAGYYVHAPSGLYLTKYRAYDPNVGRWLSRDPAGESLIGLAGGLNAYAYAGSNPVNFVDPLGLASVSFSGYVPFPGAGPVGPGGSITGGVDPNGQYFVQFGPGIGAGISVAGNPNGTSPGYDRCFRKGPRFGVGVDWSIGGGLGVAGAAITVGYGLLWKIPSVAPLGPYADIQPVISPGANKWGFSAGVDAQFSLGGLGNQY